MSGILRVVEITKAKNTDIITGSAGILAEGVSANFLQNAV
jgi:hypothetical protein